MAFSAASSSASSSEINVTPLIDVLLVLLIIFMVIVPVTPHGLDSSVPQGKAADASRALPPVVVKLLAGKLPGAVTYRVGDHDMTFEEIVPAMNEMFAARQDRTLFIEGARSMSFQQVAAVVGQGRLAGASAVVLGGSQ